MNNSFLGECGAKWDSGVNGGHRDTYSLNLQH